MNITLYGNDPRLSVCQKNLSSAPREGMLYLLPIPSFRPGVVPPFAGITPGKNDRVVGYGIPDEKRKAWEKDGAAVLDLDQDETYQKENAALTALGTFVRILQDTKTAPQDLYVGIIGCGRIGKALLRILAFYGTRLSVYTKDPEKESDLFPLGIGVYPSTAFAYHGEDVIVNTAPAHLLRREAFPDKQPLILDVATGDCIGEGISYEKLPALPLRMFESSAVRCYEEAVRRFSEVGS